ncbi:MAG: hypothetical protein K6C99_06105 [Lachnospiraceae bacterium]|nr:hypothetical protein [Lachnospiraceae bacterium]
MFSGKIKEILTGIATAAVMMPALSMAPVHAAGLVPVDQAHFPDPVFRSVVADGCDLDGNGYLDEHEIMMTRNIYCEGMGIGSLKGVEYFTSLQGLWCKDNHIASMDLSNNKDLRGVWCSGNDFTSLDFSGNPELAWVYCYDCNLTYLNVSNNPKMAYIECNTNPLTSLDLTHNPELEHLMCGSCELTSLDVSRNPNLQHLDAFRNHLTSLDLTHNPKMKRLDIWDNRGLGSVDVSKNPGLQYYNCAHNDAANIDVSNNPQLEKLVCSYNDIKLLDLSNNPKLVYLDCACNDLVNLDLSNNPQIFFLQAFTNNFATLDISNNSRLIQTFTQGVMQSEYAVCRGHSWTMDFGDGLEYFLCFDDAATLMATGGTAAPQNDSYIDVNDGLTAADDLITRETVITTLYTIAGSPDVAGLKTRFTDVTTGSVLESALKWGEANNICVGFPDVASNTFGGGQYVTRQDLAFMLHRYAEYAGYNSAFDYGRTDGFADYYEIGYYAWDAMTWAVTRHIMTGKMVPGAPDSGLRLYPHGRVTRSEFEYMLAETIS